MKTRASGNNELYILSTSAILITLFLFFIDEGNYNFAWVKEPFAWVIFMIYAIPIFLGQVFVSRYIPKKNPRKKLVLSVLIGSVIGITFTVCIFLVNSI